MKEYYKKDYLINLVKKCYSYSEVLREIGLADKGSNFNTLKKYITKYNISTEHFLGRTWNKGLSYTDKACFNKLDDILKPNTNFKSCTLKERLIKEGLKEYKCEKCGCDGYWLGEPITLELHHINGNHYDNSINNLQILCPNCHSQTPTHKKPKSVFLCTPKAKQRNKYKCTCETCGKDFHPDRERRFCSRECYEKSLSLKKKESLITKEKIENEITNCNTITELAEKLKISRTSVRKYLDDFNLLDSFKENCSSIHSKAIIQYDLNRNFIKEWASISDAEETLKIFGVSKVLKNKRKSAGGFYWKYK